MKSILLFSAASFIFSASVLAQTPAAPPEKTPPTLDALIDEIVAHNPELAFYEAEIDAAQAGRKTAGAWADPQLTIQGGRKRVRDSSGDLIGSGAAWEVSVTQTFEWPGRLGLRKSIANRQVELAELGLDRFKAALRGRARLLTYTLSAAQQKAAATAEVAARYQTLRELFLARDPAGLTPLLETRVIEAQELALKRRALAADLAARAALLELNQLRGAPAGEPVAPAETRFVFQSAPSLDALLAAARENNFTYRIRKVELEQQGFEASLARHERYPTVAVTPFYSQEKAGDRETVAGVGISVPLPLTSRTRAPAVIAGARRRQAETMLVVAQRDLERAVTEAAGVFAATVSMNAQWQGDAVEKFRDAAELADRHFRLGAVPIATYVELQNSYLDAVEALLDTRREALEAGQQLQLLTGLDFQIAEVAR